MNVVPLILVIVILALAYLGSVYIFAKQQGSTMLEFFGYNLWDYGQCRNRTSRRSRISGKVQFSVYDERQVCYWYVFDVRYWGDFKTNDIFRPRNP